METLARARLADEIPAARAVTTIISRREIAGALQDPEGSPELYLDIERIEIAQGQAVFTRAEVILRRDREALLKEADDLGIERLAATADAAQLESVLRNFVRPERHNAAQ